MGVQVVGADNFEQDIEGDTRPPGVKQRHAYVVKDLRLSEPGGGVLVSRNSPTLSLTTFKTVKSILEVIDCQVRLAHHLMQAAQIVIVMREHPIPRCLYAAVEHLDGLSVIAVQGLNVGPDKLTGLPKGPR
jgi:hypothetical protein